MWYFTDLPKDVVEILERDLIEKYDDEMEESRLVGDRLNKDKRNSKNAWVSTEHWLGGFLWHYIERANRENFLYDLRCIDAESIQYTQYGPGHFYGWHTDSGLANSHRPNFFGSMQKRRSEDYIAENTELVRKLSFVLQLSDPDDYEGGNLQLLDEEGKNYFAPRQRGCMILFDSRTKHRVLPVKSGLRKSIVGWTVGPRWK